MRYTLTNGSGDTLMEHPGLDPIAEFLGVKPAYLYVRLSAGKGSYIQGRGQAAHTVKDHGRNRSPTEGKRGPRSQDWRFVAFYLEQETDMEFKPSEEVTMEDIIKLTGLARSTISQRFASYQEVSGKISRAPKAYRYDRVVFKRVAPECDVPNA